MKNKILTAVSTIMMCFLPFIFFSQNFYPDALTLKNADDRIKMYNEFRDMAQMVKPEPYGDFS